MISFRHHVLTLVAVFLALAVGVALGGGPLSELGRGAADRLDRERERTAVVERAAEADRAALAYAGELARTLGRTSLAGRLDGRPVVLIRTASAAPELVEQVSEAVADAGGSIATTVDLADGLLASSERSLVDTLGSQLAAQTEAVAEGGTYPRVGALVGRALTTSAEEAAAADPVAVTIREGLAGADLLATEAADAPVSPLALVVVGDDEGEEQTAALAGMLQGLATAARGVVVAGSTRAAVDGTLARLREVDGSSGSTVDGAETGAGQVTAVLALVAAYSGTSGDFGASGADGTPPLG